mgnify:CR=1 FL=1
MITEKEIYNLSEKDRKAMGEPIGFQIEVNGDEYRAINSIGKTIRYLTRAEVIIPLGYERFRHKHFGVIHAK